MSSKTLAEHVQDLPAELFNNILEYTLAIAPPECILIDQSYRPPVELSITKHSREAAAAQYYSETTFIVTDAEDAIATFAKWLDSLRLKDFCEIEKILYQLNELRRKLECGAVHMTPMEWALENLYTPRTAMSKLSLHTERPLDWFLDLKVSFRPLVDGKFGEEQILTPRELMREIQKKVSG